MFAGRMQSHTVKVERQKFRAEGKRPIPDGFEVVTPALPCLVEPEGNWRKVVLTARTSGRRFKISWLGNAELLDGDIVIWNGRRWRFEFDSDDRYRPGSSLAGYQVGALTEEAKQNGG